MTLRLIQGGGERTSHAPSVFAIVNLLREADPLGLSLRDMGQLQIELLELVSLLSAELAGTPITTDTLWCPDCGRVRVHILETCCTACEEERARED